MKYVLDTNILIGLGRHEAFQDYLLGQFLTLEDEVIIPSVCLGELESMSLRKRWGAARWEYLLKILEAFEVHPIQGEALYTAYANIETYSQNQHPTRKRPDKKSDKMGKNDLWVAATAHVLEATLITADKDFVHLDGEYFELLSINPDDF
jgi:predicted nucleic acid-binding protein